VLVEAARIGEDIGALDVLRRYERWRRFDATAMTLGMDGLNRLFSTGAGPVQALRNAGLAMVGRFGAARRFFMAEAAGLSGDVPRLLTGQLV
jgi:2-octaprenyl-6-methoxyphenol hydroxylase